MIIGGIQPCSLIEYPGKTCAVLFTRGCNFRCAYCHNPELVLPEQYANPQSLTDIYSFLERRKGKLDAVCITGGEPTQHTDLIALLRTIRDMGFLIKLDSNGSRPDMLQEIIDRALVDYLAMDVKAPLDAYERIVGWRVPPAVLQRSIDLIIHSGCDHEFRTTIAAPYTTIDDLRAIARTITGAQRYYLQPFRVSKHLNPQLHHNAIPDQDGLQRLAIELLTSVQQCEVR